MSVSTKADGSVFENSDYAVMLLRMVRNYGRRLANGDPTDLPDAFAIEEALDAAIDAGVRGMRRTGFSWSEISRGAGITKQSAHERWREQGDPPDPDKPYIKVDGEWMEVLTDDGEEGS